MVVKMTEKKETGLFLKVNRFREDSGIASDLSAIDLESDDDDENACPVHYHQNNSDTAAAPARDPDDFIHSLPQEIWIKIFNHFSTYELCEIGLTSKGFLNLTRDPSLWSELFLVGDAIAETSIVVHLISRCTLLSKISITSRDDISDIIFALSNSSPKLKELYVKYCQPLTYTDLTDLARGCGLLENINLEGTGCLNGDGDTHEMEGSNKCHCGHSLSFSNLFGQFKHLTDLNLFLCRNLHSKGLEAIAEFCENLERLNIDEINYLSDESVNTFVELRGQKIKMLWIDGESLSDESFSSFEKMVNLELLSISFADNMGARGLTSLAKLEKLEWLKLRRGAELEPLDFVTAFNLGKLKSLLHLDLSECSKIDDAGIISVAKHCPTLGTLSLNWCWEITDVGLACVVNKCKFLINLNLCGVVRLLGDFLPSINKLLVGLQLLDLEQCPDVQLAILEDLVRQNMDLVIRDYYGEQVTPGRKFNDIMLDHPEITFISYDHEWDS